MLGEPISGRYTPVDQRAAFPLGFPAHVEGPRVFLSQGEVFPGPQPFRFEEQRQLLLQDPHVTDILVAQIDPLYTEMVAGIHLKVFPKADQPIIGAKVSELMEGMGGVYILDDWGSNHFEGRRPWRETTMARYGDLGINLEDIFHLDMLRGNGFVARVLGALDMLRIHGIQFNPAYKQEANKISAMFRDSEYRGLSVYDTKSPKEKVDFVRDDVVVPLARATVKAVYGQSQALYAQQAG